MIIVCSIKISAASENGEELLEPPPAEISDEPFIDDAQPLASQDPLVTEAEKLFGKDFVEIMED